jgi:nucleoside-diphosphate-sugar epimerase
VTSPPRFASAGLTSNGLTSARLLILGCGFTGTEVACRAVAAGYRVVATTRQAERREALEQLGIELHVLPALTRDAVETLIDASTQVLVAFAPDGRTDSEIAPALATADHVVYLSTTGVYGARRGHIDEATPVDPTEPRAAERLAAERCYRDAAATIVRVAGIYGPGRGLHRRLQSGTFRIPGDGGGIVSRVHVADLARMILGVFRCARAKNVDDRSSEPGAGLRELEPRGEVFVAADDTPVPHIEAIEWLCRRMELPVPARVPLDEAPATLRHDRAIDNRRIKAWTGLSLLFPSYREGFEACLSEESVNRPGFAAPPAKTPPGSPPRSE